jgi:formimidoylglutamate deiminase
MTRYFARDALLPDGWARDVLIEVDQYGDFSAIQPNSPENGAERLAGPALPGMANLHSHAFQRAMAGLTEVRGSAEDDFWTWRELMYRFAERLTPEQAQAIALYLYVEMLKHGYTAVAEFHYLHQPQEMLFRHIEAARQAGIAITLLPALYRWSGFGQRLLEPRQQRFASDVGSILDAVSILKKQNSPDVRAGIAAHSLRAVDPASLRELLAGAGKACPIHIHAAEQTREVDECAAALGKRPVEWLLEKVGLDGRWCLVHATHMTSEEIKALAQSGAVVGICPTTEANLGDGIFPLIAYRAAGGRYGIGGDSHVSRDPAEELRLLEYVQRLLSRKRNLAVTHKSPATGTTLWSEAAAGGAQAVGRAMGAISPGRRADLVILDAGHPDFATRSSDASVNVFVFSGSTGLVRDVMVAARWVVRAGHHKREQQAAAAYAACLRDLTPP